MTRFQRVFPILAILVLFMQGTLDCRAEPEKSDAADRYEFRDDHDRDGIGKFYMGREIAHVMGHLGAGWLDRPEREREEQPTRLMKAIKLEPGMEVADIGAGTGYFSFRLAEDVGPEGKVYAVDIQQEMLDIISKRMKKRGVENIELVLGEEDDPKLPENGIDAILMVDVYHEFAFPYEMGKSMVNALRPGGRLIFVEYRLEDPSVPIKLLHKMSQKQVIKEAEELGVKWLGTLDMLPRQHIIIFEKPKETEASDS